MNKECSKKRAYRQMFTIMNLEHQIQDDKNHLEYLERDLRILMDSCPQLLGGNLFCYNCDDNCGPYYEVDEDVFCRLYFEIDIRTDLPEYMRRIVTTRERIKKFKRKLKIAKKYILADSETWNFKDKG